MLFRAIALFVILNSILLETESASINGLTYLGNSQKNQNQQNQKWSSCLVIKDSQDYYLTVTKNSVLVLEKKYNGTNSQFKFLYFPASGQPSSSNYRPEFYRIASCANSQNVSWNTGSQYDQQQYYANAIKSNINTSVNSRWNIKPIGNTQYVEFVDAQKNYNLYSSFAIVQEKGYLNARYALVFGDAWPYNRTDAKNWKRLWTIEEIPKNQNFPNIIKNNQPGGKVEPLDAESDVTPSSDGSNEDSNEEHITHDDSEDSNEEHTTHDDSEVLEWEDLETTPETHVDETTPESDDDDFEWP